MLTLVKGSVCERQKPTTSDVGEILQAPMAGIARNEGAEQKHKFYRVEGIGRVTEITFGSDQDLLAHIAALGPCEVEDRAAGEFDGDLCRIPLANGGYAVIDAEDYELVKRFPWYRNKSGYAAATFWVRTRVVGALMHRLIQMAGAKDKRHIDHISGDKAASQNVWNQRLNSRNTSGIKGVSKTPNGWSGSVSANNHIYTMRFPTKEQAAAWVRAKRDELHGEFACHG
jgi:hypothetical protein